MHSPLVLDSVTELNRGLGGDRDWTVNASWGAFVPLTADQLTYAYSGSWLARKVVDVPAFDMVRAWRDWQAEDDQIETIEAEEARLQLRPKLTKALKLARLYGGGVLIMGVAQGAPDEELIPDRVTKGGLKYLHALGRDQVTAGEIELDINSPFYGEPKSYTLTGQSGAMVDIHPSRVIRLLGAERLGVYRNQDGWSDSVLDAVNDALIQAMGSAQGVAQLVQEAKVDVFSLPDFMVNVGKAEYRARALHRVRLAQQSKSLVNAVLKDASETWEQKTIAFNQLPDVVRLFLTIAAGAADIPATRLLGQSPDGQNATGESDVRNYYDRISAEQELSLRPALERLDEVMVRSALGSRPPEVHYTFAPLWQLSDKEQAEIFKTKAEAARTIVGTGGASPSIIPIEAVSDALVNALTEDGSLPGLESAIEEYGKLSEQPDDEIEEEIEPVPSRQAANDAAPRTLYVQRKLLNGAEILAWAKGQGFTATVPADDLHVTITYSRTPVDWMKVDQQWSGDDKGNLELQPGGPRLVEALGDKGAVVLLFSSWQLSHRHGQIRAAGASHDYDEYQPHVTITYDGKGLDLSKVEPYRGKLIFGPEIFEELDLDWKPSAN